MYKYTIRFVMLAVVSALWVCSSVSAETWRLGTDQQLKSIDKTRQGQYMLAVAHIKQMVNDGRSDQVSKELTKLKKDYPEIAGPDLDLFIEAEMHYSKGEFVKAIRAYEKLLTQYPESRLYDAALDRQFGIASAFLAGQKKPVLGLFKIKGYAEGEKIMDNISDRTGDAPIASEAAMAIARSFERRKKFADAYEQWSYISSRWPTGKIGKDALLGMARSKHGAYLGPKYDSSDLISAKSYYENFSLRYPPDAEKLKVAETIKQIDEQLAYKQFTIGKYYQRTGNKQSANFYYQMVIDQWPDTKAAAMAKEMTNPKKPKDKKVKK